MNIRVNQDIYLSQVSQNDKLHLIKYLNEKEIYNNTTNIPYPYREKDVDTWINFVEELKQRDGCLRHWAIRNNSGDLIGGIGYHTKYGIYSHKDEIGYWLGKPFWNKGIMTTVVKKLCAIGFNEFNFARIEATVFVNNKASKRVLEKSGFHYEGTLKNYHYKDGKFIDADLYARLF